MTSAENSVSEPPNLKIFWPGEDTPRPPYKAPACMFGTRDNAPHPPPPRYKKPSYGPGLSMFSTKSRHIANEALVRTQRCHI